MVVNARDAMAGNGHLTIQVATAAWLPSVRAHPGRVADYVTIALSDTGSGIATEKLDAIFEPFYTTTGIGQGTGLGLSLSYGIVNKHGGRIDVASEVGKGTRFTIRLPPLRFQFLRRQFAGVRIRLGMAFGLGLVGQQPVAHRQRFADIVLQ
eukprot:gene31216-31821_t